MYFLADNARNSAMTLVFTFLTPAVNIILSILLAARILYQQARISKLLGPDMKRVSPYTKIITMCTESCALIILVGIVGIITTFPEYGIWSVFPLFILPHISVCSYKAFLHFSIQSNGEQRSFHRCSLCIALGKEDHLRLSLQVK